MRVIIAGSRTGVTLDDVYEAVDRANFPISTVISGTANGADKFGEIWAFENGIPVMRVPADWDKFGRQAGIRRNCEMVLAADALVAVWDGESRGTAHIIEFAKSRGLKVFIHNVSKECVH